MTSALSPPLVAALRGLVYAVAIAALSAVVAFTDTVDAADLGKWAPLLPLLAIGVRSLEGFVDKLRGQADQLPGGSKPADPAAYRPIHLANNTAPTDVAVDPRAVARAIAGALPGDSDRTKRTRRRVTTAVLGALTDDD